MLRKKIFGQKMPLKMVNHALLWIEEPFASNSDKKKKTKTNNIFKKISGFNFPQSKYICMLTEQCNLFYQQIFNLLNEIGRACEDRRNILVFTLSQMA